MGQSQALSGGLEAPDHKMLGIILRSLVSRPAKAAFPAFSSSPVGISGTAFVDDRMVKGPAVGAPHAFPNIRFHHSPFTLLTLPFS
jgi:hypothetical protein